MTPGAEHELTISHGAWEGPVSEFRELVDEVILAAGYMIARVTIDGVTRRLPLIDWDGITKANYLGEWERTPDEPLIVLIAHSECKERIHPQEGTTVARRLEELCQQAPEDMDIETTRGFIDGLRAAAGRDEDLVFWTSREPRLGRKRQRPAANKRIREFL